MSKICKICGTEKVDGKCPNAETHYKKMCLNCVFSELLLSDSEEDEYVCGNKENLNDAVEKLKENTPGGYVIENITLKPIVLKDPTKKCKRHSIDAEKILNELKYLA